MTAILETVEREALGLPAEARAFLADRLLRSLRVDSALLLKIRPLILPALWG